MRRPSAGATASPVGGATAVLLQWKRPLHEFVRGVGENELKAAVQSHRARSGSLVMLDAHSGEILALVNQPSYNPNEVGSRPAGGMRNRAATDLYEPGSTIKPFTVLAALVSGRRHDEAWSEGGELVDFYDLKGDLESMLALTGAVFSFDAGERTGRSVVPAHQHLAPARGQLSRLPAGARGDGAPADRPGARHFRWFGSSDRPASG